MSHLREILLQPTVVLVGWSLVHFLWQGVLVALAVALILRANQRATAQARYAAAGTGLLVMLACPILTFMVMSKGGTDYSSNLGNRPGFVQPVSASGGDADPALFAPTTLLDRISHLPQRFPADRLLPLLVGVWSIGVGILALRLVLGWLRISYVRTTAVPVVNQVIRERLGDLSRRMGLRTRVALLESALAPGPAVIGVLRPAILFPAAALTGLWPIQIEAILAHELAHVRRHDYLVNLLQSFVETLLFYHPAVWWVSKMIRREREHCCDDLAVQACGDRRFYANCLADLDELRPVEMALAVGAADTGLLPRIRRILRLPAGENRAASATAGTLVVVAAATAMMFLTAAPAVSAPHELTLTSGIDIQPQAIPASIQPTDIRAAAIQAEKGASTPRSSVSPVSAVSAPAEGAVGRNAGTAVTDRADGYIGSGASWPTPNVPFPDVSMSTVLHGGWLPRLAPATPASVDATPTGKHSSPAPRSARGPAVTDFPPVSPQLDNALRSRTAVEPAAVAPAAQTPAPATTVKPNQTKPRVINYQGLLFVPDNFIVPQDPGYIVPQDDNFVTPQDRNYVIPDRNYVIPDRNYVAPRGQAGGSASISGGRMSPTPGSGNYVRPAPNK